ncbi:hypothetical protein [Ereboglobus luteus]|uniref:Uncharacterized protein n=1 Tax=Ereboglobus luteus TaxID=1796921 RepID=A0A2U8E5H5_9BACT|nr:hypothetical protein [Ereboglobus luteus]AWI10015.1 hypothetical protein CKA38_12815 [Ereboglobus luteus]
MATFTAPEIPQILTLKHWQGAKDISSSLKDKSKCEKALAELNKAFNKAGFDALAPFFKQSPAWAQYHYKRWSKTCDDLVREVIVGGVINLREAIGEVRNAAVLAEKSVDKKDPLAPKSAALLRKMAQAADALLKELRPEVIETAIRNKEKTVNNEMYKHAAAPLEDMKKHAAKAKAAGALVARNPAAPIYNKVIGSGAGGLVREMAATLISIAALPSTKGIEYAGAGDAARLAKELMASSPLPAAADKNAVAAALKNFLQTATIAAKLPKLKF